MRSAAATILILKPSSLGDVIHTLPAAAALRRKWPEARLVWMVNPEWAPLLADHPLRIEPWIFPRQQLRGVFGGIKAWSWARRRPFPAPDLALDFQGLLRSALIGKWTRPRKFLGLSDAREGAGLFYDTKARVEKEHAVVRYLKLAELAGAPALDLPVQFPLPAGEPVPELREKFVLLHPFSRGTGKSLGPEIVEQLCDLLAPIEVVLVGKAEVEVNRRPNLVNLLNRTSLRQLIWAIERAAYVVSVDSGPMHLAAAITDRLLSIHFWSDPRLVGPYSPQAYVWKDGEIRQVSDYQPGNVSGTMVPERIAEHVRSMVI